MILSDMLAGDSVACHGGVEGLDMPYVITLGGSGANFQVASATERLPLTGVVDTLGSMLRLTAAAPASLQYYARLAATIKQCLPTTGFQYPEPVGAGRSERQLMVLDNLVSLQVTEPLDGAYRGVARCFSATFAALCLSARALEQDARSRQWFWLLECAARAVTTLAYHPANLSEVHGAMTTRVSGELHAIAGEVSALDALLRQIARNSRD